MESRTLRKNEDLCETRKGLSRRSIGKEEKMELLQKKKSGRISVWLLVFALIFSVLSASLILPTHAAGMMDNAGRSIGEAVSDVGEGVGEAVSDVGEGVSEALSDMGMGDATDGAVSDGDGVIGNEGSETVDGNEESTRIGWLGIIIALIVVLIVIILIVLLIPKKKDR